MRHLMLLAIVLVTAVAPDPAGGQDLVDRFRSERIREIARQMAARHGLGLPARPPDPLGVPSDTIRAWLRRMAGIEEPVRVVPAVPPFVVDSFRVVRKLERPAFQDRFEPGPWAFHQGRRFSVLDTTSTRDLRARLEGFLGSPTRTLAEVDSVEWRPREEIIQFEYWLVVNDSLLIQIMDSNGFLDRGVVVAVEARFRDRLSEIRDALLEPAMDPRSRAPYVDYYYQAETSTWYVSGYDGASFFTRRIERPDLKLGRPFLGAYVPGATER